ncbi:HD domain-containing protein [Acetivibrio sp. MSJd-27]|uniref:HD domain-containing protein n=1 Tax=Acetivibrio sp. MSJd-27 TaxID=2841523 RepID=UPI001C0FCC43|nr:HD domain-containing protein [Acetivibrio sp. MSJd-27]MBU5449448.1 HD domain-containing protein [Acetivibrio sp. MSJd-27]
MLTFDQIEKDPEIQEYIKKSDEFLSEIGYTEHSFAHVKKVALDAGNILTTLGYDEHMVELAKMAGYIHDIGNMINRVDHAHNGAILAFTLLKERGMPPADLAMIAGAVGNHDEATGLPISPVSAALILADKSDVRRTRIRDLGNITTDIHDRVNYAVTDSKLILDLVSKDVSLKLKVDVHVSSVMEYFEIFLGRMLMCKKAAEYFGFKFGLVINRQRLL